ncbi:MAG: hypothetical protein JJLCMIEE_00440 [Acidimicrobiales bacterium]|nr:hypothetical protein [Acidimicrobiales bacterium]
MASPCNTPIYSPHSCCASSADKPESKTILLALRDGGGVVPPLLGVAKRLVERGHTVIVLGDPTVAPEAASTTGPDPEPETPSASRPPRVGRRGRAHLVSPLRCVVGREPEVPPAGRGRRGDALLALGHQLDQLDGRCTAPPTVVIGRRRRRASFGSAWISAVARHSSTSWARGAKLSSSAAARTVRVNSSTNAA